MSGQAKGFVFGVAVGIALHYAYMQSRGAMAGPKQ